jgi:toxin ParE1/3/4
VTASVTWRQCFRADAREITGYYADRGGPELAARYIHALEAAVFRIAHSPEIGSPLAQAYGIPGLRSSAMAEFPFAIFYLHSDDGVALVRALHGRRDFASLL